MKRKRTKKRRRKKIRTTLGTLKHSQEFWHNHPISKDLLLYQVGTSTVFCWVVRFFLVKGPEATQSSTPEDLRIRFLVYAFECRFQLKVDYLNNNFPSYFKCLKKISVEKKEINGDNYRNRIMIGKLKRNSVGMSNVRDPYHR